MPTPTTSRARARATTARYADEGHDVLVVTLTGGERGRHPQSGDGHARGAGTDGRDPARGDGGRGRARWGSGSTWLGFVDSGLPEGDPLPPVPEGSFALVPLEEATEALVRVVREFHPHVMTTYDENGGYPHPDHIRCHEVSMAAYEAAGDPERFPDAGEPWTPQKLYYDHGFSIRRMEVFAEEYEKLGEQFPMQEWLDRSRKYAVERGDIMARVTTQIECGKYFPQP